MPKKIQLDSAINTQSKISIRRALATLLIFLGAVGLLASSLTIKTNQPVITCPTIPDAELVATPVIGKNARSGVLSITHAAADIQQANSVINRLALQRQVTTRKQQLRALIRTNPAAAREMLLTASERQRLSQTTANCVEQEATVTGTFEAYIADDVGREPVTYYYVRTGEELQPVYGLPETELPIPGSDVALTGFTLDGDFLLAAPTIDKAASNIQILSTPALAAAGPTVKPLLMLMGDYADTDVNWPTQEMAETAVDNLNSYYAENSYGKAQWDPVTIHPWLKTSVNVDNVYCEIMPIAKALVAAADPTVDFSQFANGQIVVVAPLPDICKFGGIASLTKATFNTAEGSISTNIVWVKSKIFDINLGRVAPTNQLEFNYILNHEIGHIVNGPAGMGMGHANWQNCPPGQTFPDALGSCTIEYYYDPYDVLGGSYQKRNAAGQYTGWIDYPTGHYTADRKRWLGWIDTSQVVTINANSDAQTVDLTPIERSDTGVKLVKIQRSGADNDYWNVEYRQPLMADGVTPTTDNIFSEPYPSVFTGALVHVSLGAHTLLLDATPTPINDASDVTVGVGQTLTDPQTGATLTVVSRTADILRVAVTPPAIDYWPPPLPLMINDGPAEDIDTMPVGTSLSANWSTVVDIGTGLDRYEYRIDSSVRGEVVPWTSSGTATAVTVDPVTMTPGEIFYTSVQTIDHYGNIGDAISSDGVIVSKDNLPPAPDRIIAARPLPPDQVMVNYQVTNMATRVMASWSESADLATVASYEYAIGTTSGGTEIVGFTNVGQAYEFTHQQLGLPTGLYYVSIRAVDAEDVAGPVAATFFLIDNSPPAASSEVRDGPGADLDTTASTAELAANWDPLPDEPPLDYYYQIGTTPGGNELVSATSTYYQTKFLIQNLRLLDHTRYYITVMAKDEGGNIGARKTSDGIMVDVSSDDIPPTVTVQSPENNATVSGVINLSAIASDAEDLLGVQFYVDGSPYGSELTTVPYTLRWNTGGVESVKIENGVHTITAVARDTIHTTTSASQTITVNNATAMDTAGPKIYMNTKLQDNPIISGTIKFKVLVTDSTRPITYMIKIDDKIIYGPAEATTSSYYYPSWDSTTVANGKHILTLTGHDAIGNPSEFSPQYTIYVNNPMPIDTSPPSSITDLRAAA